MNSPVPVLEQALNIALFDERRAAATYRGVVERFGAINPFANIMQSEVRHAAAVSNLMQRYGFVVPPDPFTEAVPAKPTIVENCEVGAVAEQANGDLYAYLLGFVEEPDVRDLFMRLQAVALGNHLPAFEQCANTQRLNRMVSDAGAFLANPSKEGFANLVAGNSSSLLLGAIVGAGAVWLIDELRKKGS